MTGKYKIDSFSLLIPRESVTVIDSTFEQKFTKVFETGEIEDSELFYKNYFIVPFQGYSVKMQSVSRIWNGEEQKFIKVIVTSKFLESGYFNGLDSTNANRIVDVIASMKVITFDVETYLKSYFTDLDICIDLQVNEEGQSQIKNYYKDTVIESKRKHINSFRSSTNLQMNERPRATPAAPFLKFYNKAEELLNQSSDFYNAHLLNQSKTIQSGLYRAEVTVKNSKHKQRLEIQGCSKIIDLFSLTQSELKRIHQSILSEYIEPKRIMNRHNDLKPTETMLLNAINFFITLGQSQDMILQRLISGLTGVEKLRQKKRILALFEHITDSDKLKLNDEGQKALITNLKTLGIFGTD